MSSINPAYFESQMLIDEFNPKPSEVKGSLNSATIYYQRKLFRKFLAVWDIKLPKEWRFNWFSVLLFKYGSIAIVHSAKRWYALRYTVKEWDMYYNPAKIECTVPWSTKTLKGTIGENAAIINISPDFWGINDILIDYAEKLAACDKAINVNLMLTGKGAIIGAKTKKQADTLKEAFARSTTGEPFTIINSDLGEGVSLHDLVESLNTPYIADKIQIEKRQIMNEFLTDVGIANANYDKRERLNADEVNQNNIETRAGVDTMYRCMQEGLSLLNKAIIYTDTALDFSITLKDNYIEDSEAEAEEV